MFVTIHQSNCPTSKRIWIWILANKKISFFQPWSCSIHHLELLSNQMTAFPFAILNSCPITGRVAILNYCPIRRLLSICHLVFLTNQRQAPPPHPPPWRRTLTSTLLVPIPSPSGQGQDWSLCTCPLLKMTKKYHKQRWISSHKHNFESFKKIYLVFRTRFSEFSVTDLWNEFSVTDLWKGM